MINKFYHHKMERDRRRRLIKFKNLVRRRGLRVASCFSGIQTDTSRINFSASLDSFLRFSSLSKLRNFCIFTGKSNSTFRIFRISRQFLKFHMLNGSVFGYQKSSW